MKKMRRLFSLLMVLSLALGVLSVTAFAEDNQVWLTDGTYSGGNDNSSGETVFNTHEWNPPYSGNYNGATITISNYTADGIEANTYAQITTDKDIYVGSIVVKASDGYITYTVPDGILYAGKTYIAKSVTHAQSGAGGKGTKIHDISHVIIHDIGGLVPTAPSTPTDTGDTTTPATPAASTTPTTPVTDITTPEVPLAELPVTGTTTTVPEQPETTEDIQEPPVALASTPPATGDMGLVWFLLASVSAAGVIVLRKKETAGEQ